MIGHYCSQPGDVHEVLTALRIRHNRVFSKGRSEQQRRVVRAFGALALLWQQRLAAGWMPPAESLFPWAQVRLSLAALLPGFVEAAHWLARSRKTDTPLNANVTALVLAGNTPLLAWSPLAAALLAGQAVFIKQSRDETVWTHLLVESLAEVDADLASLTHLDLWPGEDPRTTALVNAADAVVAYGSDTTVAALRSMVPGSTPFFGFGHAASIGIVTRDAVEEAGPFARDILMYNQGGCLSAQAILVEQQQSNSPTIQDVVKVLAQSLEHECVALEIPSVTDPAVARSVRQARDMALFQGADVSVIGDPGLRWTIVLRSSSVPLELPTGSGVVQITPIGRIHDHLYDQLGAMRGYISSAGVAGTLPVLEREALIAEGVSRICTAGEMQLPPLDWPNGSIDLLAELLNVHRNAKTKVAGG